MTKSEILDYKKWFKEGGDIGFSPKRNKTIIENSIKKYEKTRFDKAMAYIGQIRERASAVESYLTYVNKGGSNTVEKYFGKKEMARLRGEDIANQLRASVPIVKK